MALILSVINGAIADKNSKIYSRGDKLKIEESIKIGRVGGSDLSLIIPREYGRVSKEHCKIDKHLLGGWTLCDLNSTNGTYVRIRGTLLRLTKEELKLEKDDVISLVKEVDLQVIEL